MSAANITTIGGAVKSTVVALGTSAVATTTAVTTIISGVQVGAESIAKDIEQWSTGRELNRTHELNGLKINAALASRTQALDARKSAIEISKKTNEIQANMSEQDIETYNELFGDILGTI